MDTKTVVTISLTTKVLEAIKKLAKRDDRSVSKYVDRVLTEHAERQKP
jgi:hypothetical protein